MHFKEGEKRTKMWNMMVSVLHWNVAEYEPYITTRLITANDLSAVRPLILQLGYELTPAETERRFRAVMSAERSCHACRRTRASHSQKRVASDEAAEGRAIFHPQERRQQR
jgi:hypothetical protein